MSAIFNNYLIRKVEDFFFERSPLKQLYRNYALRRILYFTLFYAKVIRDNFYNNTITKMKCSVV